MALVPRLLIAAFSIALLSPEVRSEEAYVTPEDAEVNRYLFQTVKEMEIQEMNGKALAAPGLAPHIDNIDPNYDPTKPKVQSLGVVRSHEIESIDQQFERRWPTDQHDFNNLETRYESHRVQQLREEQEAEQYMEAYIDALKEGARRDGYELELEGSQITGVKRLKKQ